MKKICQAGLLGLICAVSVCFAQDIPRQPPEKFVVGTTLRKQVTDEFGAPKQQGQTTKNGQNVWSLMYTHGSAFGTAHKEGVTPGRAHVFYFLNDLLVGYEFVSSFANEHTDFDEKNVEQILKGKTTRDEVVRLMGRPGGRLIHPMIKPTTGDALTYGYAEVRRTGFVSFSIARKTLVVTFDAEGVVSDLEFSTSSN